MFKSFVQKKLENYVKQYFVKHAEVKLVVVTGSVGKTSTKTNVARVLSQKFRVRMEAGNHNTEMSAPLGILGVDYPENIRSVFSWLAVFRAAKQRINDPAGVDVIVQELGTDRVGEIAHFGAYLSPDIAIVSAVTPEHMEFFGTIEKVAEEELAAANFSKSALINRDDIDGRFAEFLTNANIDTYGTTDAAEYHFAIDDFSLESGYSGRLITPDGDVRASSIKVLGEHSLRPVTAAAVVGKKLGMTDQEIGEALTLIRPVKGRMNILQGLENSIIIDDTYNSSPAAASAALQTLYELQAPQRIALLGDMRELGDSSQREHEKLGELCDPNLLAWVVTIGVESEQWLAPRARARGCQVKSFRSAIEAGKFIHSVMEKDAIILAKGSQNTVFAEEAIKIFLHATEEEKQLVRQSPAWIKIKNDFFTSLS